MICRDLLPAGPTITSFPSTFVFYNDTWIFPFKTVWRVTWCITNCDQPIFYSNHSMNFYRFCKCLYVIVMIRYIFNRAPTLFARVENMLYDLGVSLKCPGKVIFFWLDRGTSSSHVLISQPFQVLAYTRPCYRTVELYKAVNGLSVKQAIDWFKLNNMNVCNTGNRSTFYSRPVRSLT